jgi:hypothetical protein
MRMLRASGVLPTNLGSWLGLRTGGAASHQAGASPTTASDVLALGGGALGVAKFNTGMGVPPRGEARRAGTLVTGPRGNRQSWRHFNEVDRSASRAPDNNPEQ